MLAGTAQSTPLSMRTMIRIRWSRGLKVEVSTPLTRMTVPSVTASDGTWSLPDTQAKMPSLYAEKRHLGSVWLPCTATE